MHNYNFRLDFKTSLERYIESIQPISRQQVDAILVKQKTFLK